MQVSVALASAGIALSMLACSNPRCWTHDPSEVEGGCSVFSGSRSSRGTVEPQRDDVRAGLAARIARQRPACAAGDAIACSNVAADLERLEGAPPAQRTAAMAAACRAKVLTTRTSTYPCLVAAQRTLATSTAEARALYELGCELGIVAACTEASGLGSSRVVGLLEASCARAQLPSCDALTAFYSDPRSPHFDAAKARAHLAASCLRDEPAACEQLGRSEVSR